MMRSSDDLAMKLQHRLKETGASRVWRSGCKLFSQARNFGAMISQRFANCNEHAEIHTFEEHDTFNARITYVIVHEYNNERPCTPSRKWRRFAHSFRPARWLGVVLIAGKTSNYVQVCRVAVRAHCGPEPQSTYWFAYRSGPAAPLSRVTTARFCFAPSKTPSLAGL